MRFMLITDRNRWALVKHPNGLLS